VTRDKQLSLIPQCATARCDKAPEYRFTWPGQKEQLACAGCAQRAQNVAKATGFDLEVRPFFPF
jgi:hypothetical protein